MNSETSWQDNWVVQLGRWFPILLTGGGESTPDTRVLRVEPYTQEELKRLLAVCGLDIRNSAPLTGLRNRSMLLLFLDSGLRRAEMANLKLRDLHLEARLITVIGKGNNSSRWNVQLGGWLHH